MGISPAKMNKRFETKIRKDTASDDQICVVKEVSLTAGENSNILLDPQSTSFFEGAVLEAESIDDGRFAVLTDERRPINISISVPNFGKIRTKIDSPNISTTRQGVKNIIWSTTSGSIPSTIAAKVYDARSEEELAISLKGKYSAGFGNVSSIFDFSNKSVKSRFLVDVTQIYYSIDVDPKPADSFFVRKKLTRQLKYSPVYVASIKYGKRIIYSIESQKDIQNLKLQIEAEFNGLITSGSGSSSTILHRLVEERSVKAVGIGGNTAVIYDLIGRPGALYETLKRNSEWSKNNLGLPLAYALKNISDNGIFKMVQSGTYNLRECHPVPASDYLIPSFVIGQQYPQRIISGDKDFGGNGPDVTLDIQLTFEGKSIFANVYCKWMETKSNFTAADFRQTFLVATVPEDYTILNIASISSFNITYLDLGHELDGNTYKPGDGVVSSYSIMGDQKGDDLVGGGTRIESIVLQPIKLNVKRTKHTK